MPTGTDSPAAARFRAKIAAMPPCNRCGYAKNEYGASKCEVCSDPYPREVLLGRMPTSEEAYAEAARLEAEAMSDAREGYGSLARRQLETSVQLKNLARNLRARELGSAAPGFIDSAREAGIPRSVVITAALHGGPEGSEAIREPRRKGWAGALDWFVPAHVRSGFLGWLTGRR